MKKTVKETISNKIYKIINKTKAKHNKKLYNLINAEKKDNKKIAETCDTEIRNNIIYDNKMKNLKDINSIEWKKKSSHIFLNTTFPTKENLIL